MDRIIRSLVADFSKEYDIESLPLSEQFERFAAYCVVSTRGAQETFAPEDVTVDGNELGIDGLAIQVNGRVVTDPEEIQGLQEQNGFLEVTFVFVQAKTSESFSASAVEMMGRAVKDFVADEPRLPKSQFLTRARDVYDAIYDRARYFRGKPALEAFYITTGVWSEQEEIAAAMRAVEEELQGGRLFSSVAFRPVDADGLNELFRRAHEPVEAQFAFPRKTTMPAEIAGIESAYVGVVAASEFLRLVEDDEGRLRTSLFEDNVRDYMGIDTPVNRNMTATVQGSGASRFPVLNNGVTVIAREVQTVRDDVIVGQYQIVNGCQTANVIHANRDRANEFWVPLKVIETRDDDLITEIVTSTNNQNPVKAEELNSRSRFERRIEEYFAAVDRTDVGKGLRYERRTRQYASDTGVVAARVITRRILVRSYVSFCLDEPHRATGYVTSLIEQLGTGHFVDGHRPEPYYTSALAHYKLDNMFNATRIDGQFRPARWHLLMAFRHLALDGEELASPTSRAIVKQVERVDKILNDDQKAIELFNEAVAVVETSLGTQLDRDSLRAERPTEALREALLASQVE
jgi:hypothetical protein